MAQFQPFVLNMQAPTVRPVVRYPQQFSTGVDGEDDVLAGRVSQNNKEVAVKGGYGRLQNRTASANEVTPKTEPGTTSSQQVEVFLENKRNPKRTRGSDSEYTEPITMVALLEDIDTLKDTSTSRPDTKRCIQVGRETYAVTSQPGTPYTSDPRTDEGTILGQRLQPVTDIQEHTTQEVTRWKSTKPQKPNRHKNRWNNTQGRTIDKLRSASRRIYKTDTYTIVVNFRNHNL